MAYRAVLHILDNGATFPNDIQDISILVAAVAPGMLRVGKQRGPVTEFSDYAPVA